MRVPEWLSSYSFCPLCYNFGKIRDAIMLVVGVKMLEKQWSNLITSKGEQEEG
jgi:hypothetical protein